MRKVFLLLSFLAFISCGNSTPDESDAKEAARAAIIQNLKNPSGVTFHHNEIIKDLGDGAFEYVETVNATNSFGGVLAQNVTTKIKWLGGDPSEVQNWSVLDIQFVER